MDKFESKDEIKPVEAKDDIECDVLRLARGERIKKLLKVYWSRQRDQILARLAILKPTQRRNLRPH